MSTTDSALFDIVASERQLDRLQARRHDRISVARIEVLK